MLESKNLILFVHGFLGDETSFGNFPLDLVHSIRNHHKLKNIEARVFPFFSTTGDPNKSVNMLHNWLLLNASQPEYESVIIIAHSMGGLIAADAIRKLWESQRNVVEPFLSNPKSFVIAKAELELGQLRSKTSIEDLKAEAKALQEDVDKHKEDSGLPWEGNKENIAVSSIGDTLQSIPVYADGPTVQDKTKKSTNSTSNKYFLANQVAAADEIADFVTGFVPGSGPKEIVRSTVRYSTAMTTKIVMGVPAATSAVINTTAAIPGATVRGLVAAPAMVGNAVSSLWSATEKKNSNTEESQELTTGTTVVAAPGELGTNLEEKSKTSGMLSYLNPVSYVFNPFSSVTSKTEEPITAIEEEDDSDEKSENNEGNSNGPDLLPIPRDTDWTPWISLGLTTAALVGGAYYYTGSFVAFSTMSVVRRLALAYAVSHAEDARQKLRFLYPIWGESNEDLCARVSALHNESKSDSFMFKCYFHEVVADVKMGEKQNRSFIKRPDDKEEWNIRFIPIGSDSPNEIVGHMNMFSRTENAGFYWDMIHKTSLDIKDIIRKWKGSYEIDHLQ